MKRAVLLLSLLALFFLLPAQKYLSGYSKSIEGKDFIYHAPQPDAADALLVRSNKTYPAIEWETQPVPEDFRDDEATFLLLAAFDVAEKRPHNWTMMINGESYFNLKSPVDTLQKEIRKTGPNESSLLFKATKVDKYGDLLGYLFLTLKKDDLTKGEPVTIRVEGQLAKSAVWFMVYKYEAKDYLEVSPEPAIKRGPKGPEQVLKIEVAHYGDPAEARFEIAGNKFYKTLDFGYKLFFLQVPKATQAKSIAIRAIIDNKILADKSITLEPVKETTLYLLPHSHVDIGYTHHQDEVEKMQWSYLEQAVDLAKKSQHLPEEARFKWNTEVMWAIESYLEQASEPERIALITALRKGWIELNAMYANELTGLCTQEELLRLFDYRNNPNLQGVRTKSAMISDIPGWSWGLVPAMAGNGIKYFSCGTNSGHRIGNIIEKLGDKPFYWLSPSREDSVLTWVHAKGYSYFHTGLGATQLKNLLTESKIFAYLDEMEARNYPYDMAMLRYNIGADNGPPDSRLSMKVNNWNKIYESPKLVIATVSEAFSAFEKKYGDQLPSLYGDITGYWEDGTASTARETALNRSNAARLSQTETLFAIFNPSNFSENSVGKLWDQILLFDEHTWGSWNSISEPESEFTLSQWNHKKNYAEKAKQEIDDLQQDVMKSIINSSEKPVNLKVVNTSSWERSGWLTLPVKTKMQVKISDNRGREVDTKQNAKGELLFLAGEIAPFGTEIFEVEYLPNPIPKYKTKERYTLSGKNINLEIDPENGSIKSLFWDGAKINLADHSQFGLNQYLYTSGRNPENLQSAEVTAVSHPSPGVMYISMKVPGCRQLITEIVLMDELSTIRISNTLFKEEVKSPEAVRFAFPLNIPEGSMHYDMAFAQCTRGKDQLPGSNKNFITIENFVDISNEDFGITWSSPDAPLVETGKPMNDATVFGYAEKTEPSQTIFSYVMNNYWETNYKASQAGEVTFTYYLKFHDGYNPAQAEKSGMEARMPLLVFPVNDDVESPETFFEPDNENILAFAARPAETGIIVSMMNCSDHPQQLKPKIRGNSWLTNYIGNSRRSYQKTIDFPAWGVRHLFIELEEMKEKQNKRMKVDFRERE